MTSKDVSACTVNGAIIASTSMQALHVLCSAMSKSSPRVLVSSPLHSRGAHGESRLQFPRLPPEWEERYKPGQMYRNQASIPKLPVPPLQQTLQKYITSVEVWNIAGVFVVVVMVIIVSQTTTSVACNMQQEVHCTQLKHYFSGSSHLSVFCYIGALISHFPPAVQPLLSTEELENTKAAVKDFGREGGAGEKLQQALLERAESLENWVGAMGGVGSKAIATIELAFIHRTIPVLKSHHEFAVCSKTSLPPSLPPFFF